MLTDNPQAVANLFNSENGVASRLVELIKPYVESYGIIDDRKQSVEDQITAADKRIERFEKRLELKEASYRLQFTTLQGMLNQITNQQSILSSLTSSLNSILGLG
jgi:flagellar hook-associated protein 2